MVWFWLNHFSVHQPRPICAGRSATTRSAPSGPTRSGTSGIWCSRRSSTRPCCSTWTTLRMPPATSMRTTRVSSWSCTRSGSMRGYTQQDVQELARVLTGVGVNVGASPRLRPEWQRLYVREGAFEFNPARHDFGPKCCSGTGSRAAALPKSRSGRADRRAARLRALHLAPARDLLRRRQSAAAAHRAHGADFHAHRRRHRGGAAHAVPGARIERRARRQVQGSDALRRFGGALCLRWPPDHQHAPAAQLAQWPGRDCRSAARRPTAIR